MFTLTREKGKFNGMFPFLLIYLIVCGALWPFLDSILAFTWQILSTEGKFVTGTEGLSMATISNMLIVFLLFLVASVIHAVRLLYFRQKFSEDYEKMRSHTQSEPWKFRSDWIRIGIWFLTILFLAGVVAIWLVTKPRIIAESVLSFGISTLIAFYVVGGVLDFFRYVPLWGRLSRAGREDQGVKK